MAVESGYVTVTLDPDGHLAVPAEISEAAGIRPGGKVRLAVVAPGRFEVIAAEAVIASVSEDNDAADEIEPMTLEEAFTRFRTDEPVDLQKIRQEWEEDAAQEVLAELERNVRRSD